MLRRQKEESERRQREQQDGEGVTMSISGVDSEHTSMAAEEADSGTDSDREASVKSEVHEWRVRSAEQVPQLP